MPIHMATSGRDEAAADRIDIDEKVGGPAPIVNRDPS